MCMQSKKNDPPEPVDYKTSLHGLQIELIKLQPHLIKNTCEFCSHSRAVMPRIRIG